MLESLYLDCHENGLSSINRIFIECICDFLGIKTVMRNSWDYSLPDGRVEKLVALCEQAAASIYVSGPAAKGYLDENMFVERGIEVQWFDYGNYPPYPQLWGDFCHEVSILDLLFNCGKAAARYMKYVSHAESTA